MPPNTFRGWMRKALSPNDDGRESVDRNIGRNCGSQSRSPPKKRNRGGDWWL